MSIPAGWYDDGSGAQRWWDGTGWTEHIADPTPPTPAYEPVAQDVSAPAAAPSHTLQPAAPYATQQYASQPYAPAPGSTNGLAITALVLGILGFGVIAVIFGHIAMGQLKRNPQQEGRGLAIAGLILGYIVVGFWVVLIAIGIIGAVLSAVTRY